MNPTAHPTPIPALAPVDSPLEEDGFDVAVADVDVDCELEVGEASEEVDRVEAKSVAWYRIETP